MGMERAVSAIQRSSKYPGTFGAVTSGIAVTVPLLQVGSRGSEPGQRGGAAHLMLSTAPTRAALGKERGDE